MHTVWMSQVVLSFASTCIQAVSKDPMSTATACAIAALHALLRRAELDGILTATGSAGNGTGSTSLDTSAASGSTSLGPAAAAVYRQLEESGVLQQLPALMQSASQELTAKGSTPPYSALVDAAAALDSNTKGTGGPCLFGPVSTGWSSAVLAAAAEDSQLYSALLAAESANLFTLNIVSITTMLLYIYDVAVPPQTPERQALQAQTASQTCRAAVEAAHAPLLATGLPAAAAVQAEESGALHLALTAVQYFSKQTQAQGHRNARQDIFCQLSAQAYRTVESVLSRLPSFNVAGYRLRLEAVDAVVEMAAGLMPSLVLFTAVGAFSLLTEQLVARRPESVVIAGGSNSAGAQSSSMRPVSSCQQQQQQQSRDVATHTCELVEQLQQYITPQHTEVFALIGVDSRAVLFTAAAAVGTVSMQSLQSLLHTQDALLGILVCRSNVPTTFSSFAQLCALLPVLTAHWLSEMPVGSGYPAQKLGLFRLLNSLLRSGVNVHMNIMRIAIGAPRSTCRRGFDVLVAPYAAKCLVNMQQQCQVLLLGQLSVSNAAQHMQLGTDSSGSSSSDGSASGVTGSSFADGTFVDTTQQQAELVRMLRSFFHGTMGPLPAAPSAAALPSVELFIRAQAAAGTAPTASRQLQTHSQGGFADACEAAVMLAMGCLALPIADWQQLYSALATVAKAIAAADQAALCQNGFEVLEECHQDAVLTLQTAMRTAAAAAAATGSSSSASSSTAAAPDWTLTLQHQRQQHLQPHQQGLWDSKQACLHRQEQPTSLVLIRQTRLVSALCCPSFPFLGGG